MAITEAETNRARKAQLLKELSDSWTHHRHWQRMNFYTSIVLMVLVVLSTSAAPLLALFDADKKYIGAAALLPAIWVGLASAFNPGGRAEWADRRKNAVNELRRKLAYELPDSPSNEQLAEISAAWSKLDREHQKELAQRYTLGIDAFSKLLRRSK